MECRCDIQNTQAWGIPACGPIPERIVKMFFTPSLETMAFSQNTDGYKVLAPSFPYAQPWMYEDEINNSNYSLWSYVWAMVTPLIDVVESERGEGVREEVGGNSYFVKYSNRSFTATMAKKPVELGELIANLRCLQTAGVFLLDANGVLWGRRGVTNVVGGESSNTYAETVRPIPINTQTIDERMIFAGDTTVQKWVFSFQLAQEMMDYEFVPIYFDKRLLSYTPPMNLSVNYDSSNDRAFIYAHFAVGSSRTLLNVTDLLIYPKAHDANGPMPNDTTTWSVNGDGYDLTDIPSGTTHYRYTAQQLLTVTDNRYNLFDLVITI